MLTRMSQVFGNSASIPLPLITSLSQTVESLRWDQVPDDDAQKAASRGILYLLIFQQLGLILRWSWGYNVLLAPPSRFEEEGCFVNFTTERDQVVLQDENEHEQEQEDNLEPWESNETQSSFPCQVWSDSVDSIHDVAQRYRRGSQNASNHELEPIMRPHGVSLISEALPTTETRPDPIAGPHVTPATMISITANGNEDPETDGSSTRPSPFQPNKQWKVNIKRRSIRIAERVDRSISRISSWMHIAADKVLLLVPDPLQRILTRVLVGVRCFLRGFWDFMNPPLIAILLAIIVGSAPSLQRLFFTDDTFIHNSITRAISHGGDVAIPLILVVLGANLARNTIVEKPGHSTADHEAEERKLLIASLVSRMVLPTIVMVPLLALIAKKITFSVLGDPVFIVVCFLLSGAPSALQLAQICQFNRVYVSVMSKLLFQSYVVWYVILIIVILASQVGFNLGHLLIFDLLSGYSPQLLSSWCALWELVNDAQFAHATSRDLITEVYPSGGWPILGAGNGSRPRIPQNSVVCREVLEVGIVRGPASPVLPMSMSRWRSYL